MITIVILSALLWPYAEARLMLHGLKSGNFGIASPSAASLALSGSYRVGGAIGFRVLEEL